MTEKQCAGCSQVHREGEDCWKAIVRKLTELEHERDRNPEVVRIRRFGNSIGIIIPSNHIKRLGLNPDVSGENLVLVNFWDIIKKEE